MIKLIFRIIRLVITVIIITAIISYPIIMYDVGPFTFYWDKICAFWDSIKSLPITDKVIGIFNK